jgi:hypothetical protein
MVSVNHVKAVLESGYEHNIQVFHFVTVRKLGAITDICSRKHICNVSVRKHQSTQCKTKDNMILIFRVLLRISSFVGKKTRNITEIT